MKVQGTCCACGETTPICLSCGRCQADTNYCPECTPEHQLALWQRTIIIIAIIVTFCSLLGGLLI